MDDKKYVLKLDGDYYAGQNPKYWDMINLSGSGAIGAKKMNKEDAEKSRNHFIKNGWTVEIEEYEPKRYIKEALEKIIKCEQGRKEGKDYGYLVENLAKHCIDYLNQI